jgi:hypothetical protein
VKVGDLVRDEDGDYGIVTSVDSQDEDRMKILFPTTIDGDVAITYTMYKNQIVKVVSQ